MAHSAKAGRTTLARFSRAILRAKFLGDDSKRSIDAIREGLQGKNRLTFGVFLCYALSPLPSKYAFIAHGLTTMELRLSAIPFFLGRAVSYSFWGLTSSFVGRTMPMNSGGILSYLGGYFIASQILLLGLVYLFTRLDWRAAFSERRFRLRSRKSRAARIP